MGGATAVGASAWRCQGPSVKIAHHRALPGVGALPWVNDRTSAGGKLAARGGSLPNRALVRAGGAFSVRLRDPAAVQARNVAQGDAAPSRRAARGGKPHLPRGGLSG